MYANNVLCPVPVCYNGLLHPQTAPFSNEVHSCIFLNSFITDFAIFKIVRCCHENQLPSELTIKRCLSVSVQGTMCSLVTLSRASFSNS